MSILSYALLPLSLSLYLTRPYMPRRIEYYINLTLYLSSLSCVATYAAFAAIFLNIIGRPYDVNHLTARSFYFVTSRLLGLKLEVVGDGAELLGEGPGSVGRPVVVMHNHQSMLDILILGFLTPRRSIIISKNSLKYSPLGPFMLLSRSIFLNRGDPASAIAEMKRASRTVREKGLALWMFPEGTRTNTKEVTLRPFKKGGFHLAIEDGIPIVPVVTENYWRVYHKGFFQTPATIRVKVLPPIQTAGLTSDDAGHLAETIREQMLAALHELQELAEEEPSFSSQTQSGEQHPPVQEKEKTPVPPTPPHPLSSLSPSKPVDAAEDAASTESSSNGDGEEIPPAPSSSASTSSLVNLSSSMHGGNGGGNETEEEEGMVIVGRPTP